MRCDESNSMPVSEEIEEGHRSGRSGNTNRRESAGLGIFEGRRIQKRYMEVWIALDVIKGEQTVTRKCHVPELRCRVPGYFTQRHQIDASVLRGGRLEYAPDTRTLFVVSLT